MTNSQNGWPARADTSRFTRFTAAGQRWWAANPDVAVVLGEFIERFNREVEPIYGDVLDDWSYANRLVRGSTSVVSNHGSATAVDINALRHGRGRHGTFTAAKARKVRAIRNAITDDAGRPVLRLGMDFKTVPDDMHVEICTGPRSVHQAAEKIRKRAKSRQQEEEDVKVEFTDEQLKKLGAAMLDAPIELTEAAAKAIGGDTKPGQVVSLRYAVLWSPLVRRVAREDAARDAAEAQRDTAQDQRIAAVQKAVDDLTVAVGQMARTAGAIVNPREFAAQVAAELAERLKS